MIAITDRTRSTLYVTSAALLVGWSIGEVSIAKSYAAESLVLPDVRAGAPATDKALDAKPPLAPIVRDPFAGAFSTPRPKPSPTAAATALSGHATDGGYDVPNLGAGSGDKATHVVLEGIVSGGAQSSASAIVLSDQETRLVHVGDEIGAWTIVSIDASGITFNNGHRLTMDMSAPK